MTAAEYLRELAKHMDTRTIETQRIKQALLACAELVEALTDDAIERMGETAANDICPEDIRGHTFSDYGYWREKGEKNHPKCHCGYEDKSRELPPTGSPPEPK